MDINKPRCCGTCKYWENSVKTETVFERYGSVGMCKVKGTLERYASKCKEYGQKEQARPKGDRRE